RLIPSPFGLSPSPGSGQATRSEVEGRWPRARLTLRLRRWRGHAQSERSVSSQDAPHCTNVLWFDLESMRPSLPTRIRNASDLTGSYVNLDRLHVAERRSPITGVLDHSHLMAHLA